MICLVYVEMSWTNQVVTDHFANLFNICNDVFIQMLTTVFLNLIGDKYELLIFNSTSDHALVFWDLKVPF